MIKYQIKLEGLDYIYGVDSHNRKEIFTAEEVTQHITRIKSNKHRTTWLVRVVPVEVAEKRNRVQEVIENHKRDHSRLLHWKQCSRTECRKLQALVLRAQNDANT